MSAKPLDIIVFITLLPVLPIVIAPWLPWDEFLWWKKLPNRVFGPYLLYCAFVGAWYLSPPWWSVAVAILPGLGVCCVAICEHKKKHGT